jgi:K+-transporting ATPase ATPase B chain
METTGAWKSKAPSGMSVGVVLREALRKLSPRLMWFNPVMFVVEIGCAVTVALALSASGPAARAYDLLVASVLFVTLLFATFAEAYAEGRGRAQADSLRRLRGTVRARLIPNGGHPDEAVIVDAGVLRRGARVRVDEGDTIPGDGVVVVGTGAVDESAITGESASVLKGEGDPVTGGTVLLSNQLLVAISVDPGESFLDRMIRLVEGAKRQKTPNETALTALLAVLTLIFVLVVATLVPIAHYFGPHATQSATMVALLVCLIPTTIGALLSAIGIAGMNRVAAVNVIAKSGRAVEVAGDVDTLILDKTGTITTGNRLATEFRCLPGVSQDDIAWAAWASSLADSTPEGRSVVKLAERILAGRVPKTPEGDPVPFSARTRMSGIDLKDGHRIRKGALGAIGALVSDAPALMDEVGEAVAREGATPLAVAVDDQVLGIIRLSDVVKTDLRPRLGALRAMGIRTIMATGDNRITAAVIARQAGVDDYVAEATPEDKIALIRREQRTGRLVAMSGDGTNDAPALAQADVGLVMDSGTMAAKEAGNMIDLDSDPTKLLDVVMIGKQLLITRGALTTFSIANDVAKYFAILPAMFASVPTLRVLSALNIMHLKTPHGAILSALLFNALIIPALIPFATRGVPYRAESAQRMLARNVFNWGVVGVVAPFAGIFAIDRILALFGLG